MAIPPLTPTGQHVQLPADLPELELNSDQPIGQNAGPDEVSDAESEVPSSPASPEPTEAESDDENAATDTQPPA